MKHSPTEGIDIRQSKEWGTYLQKIGWVIEHVGTTQIAINTLPLIKRSVIKIQHPTGPLPLTEIDAIARQYKALFVQIEPHTIGYDEVSLKTYGYQQSCMQFAPTATIKKDLTLPEHELLASLSENARRNIKKAQKNNLEVKIVWSKDDIDDKFFKQFYSLLMSLTKLKKFSTSSYEEFHKKMTAFRETSVMLFAYEKGTDEPNAVVWLASAKETITYMQTGITKRGYELLANYLLVWESFTLAKKAGMNHFDFEIIYDRRHPREHKNWKGYTEFKKRFHGTIVEYPPTWIKFHSKLYHFFYVCTSFLPS